MFIIAAISDIHLDKNNLEKDFFNKINGNTDLFIFGGDIGNGDKEYVEQFMKLISDIKVPIIIVLGNHDKFSDDYDEIINIILTNPLVKILDGDYVEYEFNKQKIGIAGVSGYGGGFPSKDSDNRGIDKLLSFQKEINKPTPDFILDQMNWDEENKEVEKLNYALNEMKDKKPDFSMVITHWITFREMIDSGKEHFMPLWGSSKMEEEILKFNPNLVLSGHYHYSKQGLKKINDKITACNIGYKVNNKEICLFNISKNNKFTLSFL